jgi:hypothetical protein
LVDSTFLNNCGAIYLVNNINLLDNTKYNRIISDNIIEYRTSSLDIIGYRIYIIKNYLYKEYRSNTKDLILINIVLIFGFYINIVSEARLRNSDL